LFLLIWQVVSLCIIYHHLNRALLISLEKANGSVNLFVSSFLPTRCFFLLPVADRVSWVYLRRDIALT